MKRILAIAHKEFLHIIRDPRSLSLAVAMPILMVLIYGYAIDMEMKDLKVAILDYDRTVESRALIRDLTSGGFIIDAARLVSREEIEPGFRRNRFRAAIIIPDGYASSVQRQDVTPLQVLVDGADGSTATAVNNYLNAVVARINYDLSGARLTGIDPPIQSRPRVWYNPELKSANFIVPGLAAVVLVMICALLTSIAVTREKETGTMEQILTTPVRPGQVIVGKVIPYMGIGIVDTALVLIIGGAIFGVPMAGSWLVLTGYSILYVVVSLAMGLLISALVQTQQLAMMAALVVTMLPTIMLSGFIFPATSMPVPLQVIGHVIPATYYITILRGVMLKGQAWFPVEGAVLAVMAVVLMTLAARRFHSRLES